MKAPERSRALAPRTHRGLTVVGRLTRGLAGLVIGSLSGLVLLLAIASFRTAVEEVYMHSAGEVVGWISVPGVVAVVLGTTAGFVLDARRFWRLTLVGVVGLVGGGVVGALLGGMLVSHAAGPWAGGLMGAGGGLVLAVLGWSVAVFGTDRRAPPVTAALGALVLAACSPAAPAPNEVRQMPEPDSSEVEAVVFLLGDPGVARMSTHPVLAGMREDVERWSARLGARKPVTMLVLGDIMYPVGLHPSGHELRARDSARVADQIEVVSGPHASAAGTRGIFIPGNHDWGQEEDWEGAQRLVRLQTLLKEWRGPAAGRLTVSPAPGSGGPGVIDLGPGLRLVLLDTAWWLLGSDPAAKDRVLNRVRQALDVPDDRRVVMAAHHPLESGGPHGTVADFSRALGLRYVLQKAGILLQDLDSRPYSDLRRRLRGVFADAGPPDFFVGGHEHSLQVFVSQEVEAERSAVIGSASKLTSVRDTPGMVFGRSEPGYGKIFVLRDGTLHFRIEAAPADYLECPAEGDGRGEDRSCIVEGIDAFRTVWAVNLDPGE